jgi:hypothetical protein
MPQQGVMPQQGLRPGYERGLGPVGREFMTDEEASRGNPGNAELYEEEIIKNQPPLEIITGEAEMYGGKPLLIEIGGKYYVMQDGKFIPFTSKEEAQDYVTQVKPFNKGGRVKRDNGGIMDLGGMEKDYRTTGGFVPIGGRERADDVPARLSKNEFVMTADAVRAAGGGSINRGAQRMYDTMKHLEASPQSNRMIS